MTTSLIAKLPGKSACQRALLVFGLTTVWAMVLSGCAGSQKSTTARLAALTHAPPPSLSCVSVYPSPGTHSASRTSQVSLRKISPGSAASGTVAVTGTASGLHSGRWVADSDDQGASFFPTHPFTSGERVRVSVGRRVCGVPGDADVFWIVVPPIRLAETTAAVAGRSRTGAQVTVEASLRTTRRRATTRYRTLPGASIPVLNVGRAADLRGDLFETPHGRSGPGALEILDGHGNLVWYHRLPGDLVAADFRAQTYQGHEVLTWWQDGGPGGSEYVIMDSRYQIIRTLKTANGYSTDEHEFLLSNNGRYAWVIGGQLISADMRGRGGPQRAPIVEEVAQEIDVATGNVLFEWHSSDHVPPSASYAPYLPRREYDYFHMNSIDPLANGSVVISARNTHAVFAVAKSTGQLLWELGGKHSRFTMGPGASFALQHDARMHGSTTISIFDDQDAPPRYAPARALLLHLDFVRRTATVVRSLAHQGLKVPWQGNQQILPTGETVVGWGSGSATSAYNRSGRLLFDATYAPPINSYRAYVMPWSGYPTAPPSVATQRTGRGVSVFASWNGSTTTRRWVVLGGPSLSNLHRLASAVRQGFQTLVRLASRPEFLQVDAETASGQVIATSPAIRS